MPRDVSTSVRAVVRVRPLLPHELDRGEQSCCDVQDETTLLFRAGHAGNNWRQYAFDACVPPAHSQKQFFQECGVASLLESAVQGYSATVLAYGQTGSGKTHTMMGRHASELASKQDEGLVIRSAKRIFRIIMGGKGDGSGGGGGTPANAASCYTVRASFTEIYNAPGAVNECICDLLSPDTRNLQVRHNQRFGFYITDVCVVDCCSSSEVRAVLEAGLQNRRIGAHQLNKDSSRSHALFTLYVDYQEPRDAAALGSTGEPPFRRHGKITFVDLAGSERLKESCAEGNARKETQAINKSLFTLGQVISQLAHGKSASHVPYRNSKLTQLLQESFGGEALCLMVTNISPASTFAEESLNSLNYAQKAMNIRNRPVVRLDERQRVVHDLKVENAALRRELDAYRATYGALSPTALMKLASAGSTLAPGVHPAALEGPLSAVTVMPGQQALGAAPTLDLASVGGAPRDCGAEVAVATPGSRSSSKHSQADTPWSASCSRPRGGPDAAEGCRRSSSASEGTRSARKKRTSETADVEAPPTLAKPQRPPVPSSTGSSYAGAAARRRIQPAPQPRQSAASRLQVAARTELPPLPGRSPPANVSPASSPAWQTAPSSGTGSRPDAAPPSRGSALPEDRPVPASRAGGQPMLGSRAGIEPAHTGQARNEAAPGSCIGSKPMPGSSVDVMTMRAPPGRNARAGGAILTAGSSGVTRALARTNSAEQISHVTKSQINHLDAMDPSAWKFDFGKSGCPQGEAAARGGEGGVRAGRCGAGSTDASSATGDAGGLAARRAQGGSGPRSAGVRGGANDGSAAARSRGETSAGSSSCSSSATSSRSSSGSPAGTGPEDANGDPGGQPVRNLSFAALNAKLASMQMATVALTQPASS